MNSIILSLVLPGTDLKSHQEEINELELLANTLGYSVLEKIHQNKNKINASTFFGKGKIESVANICKNLDCKILIINDEIEPGHHKSIKKICGDKISIIDRTQLILDIFNSHAKTKEAKTQIKLATLQYMLPRLVGQWTHLERQMGGLGTRGGPGEKQIEIDRRLIRKAISSLKNDLKKIESHHSNQIKNRANIFKIALAGYTNSGKSTLLKELSGYNAYIKDQLFATLDTVTKKVTLPSKTNVLISDTVGFLRKLPHNLIASFRTTLSEIIEADLIIKVIDISSSDMDGHIETINETLKFLDVHKTPSLYVFNKIDLIQESNMFELISNKYNSPILISASSKLNINKLINKIDELAHEKLYKINVKIPHNQLSLIEYLYNNTSVLNRRDEYEFVDFDIEGTKKSIQYIKSKLK